MSQCPHCNKNTIGAIRKFWSDSACPVRCPECNGLAYLHNRETDGLAYILNGGLMTLPFIVIVSGAIWPIAVWVACWLALFALVLWRSPLTPISEEQANENKRYGNMVVALVVLAGVVWWAVAHG